MIYITNSSVIDIDQKKFANRKVVLCEEQFWDLWRNGIFAVVNDLMSSKKKATGFGSNQNKVFFSSIFPSVINNY